MARNIVQEGMQMRRAYWLYLVTLQGACAVCGAADPTPQQIASQWATFSGGLGGKVLSGKADNKLWILDLQTGMSTAITDFPLAYVGTSGAWGPTIGLKISPDGARVAAQNNSAVIVCNIDGTNKQIIWQGSIDYDMMALCWDGNDKVYYSRKTKVVYTDILADNRPGATHDVITRAPRGCGIYTGVQKSGDYVCVEEPCNPGGNLPCMFKISTGEFRYVLTTDGCQARMIFDGSGRLVCHESTHMRPATIVNWNGQRVGSVPEAGTCGINGVNFSYDGRFAINVGDNDLNLHSQCITQTYIRKVSDWSSLYISSSMYWPDIWIGASAPAVAAPQFQPDDISFIDSVRVTITCATAGAQIRYTLDGADPTASSALYAAPVKLTATTTIKAVAFSGGRQSNVAQKNYVKAVLRAAENPANTENGLWYRYYEGTWSALPAFAALTPVDTGPVSDFSLTPRRRDSNYAFLYRGFVDVPQDGIYTFFVNCTDGGALMIGDTVVVNNDGVHALRETSGAIGLRAGKHSLQVRFFDANGGGALNVQYQMGALITKRAIPPGTLFRVRSTAQPWVEVTAPVAGQRIRLGDTLVVTWVYHGGANHMVNVNLSIDGGDSYGYSLTGGNAYTMGSSENGAIRYALPRDVSMVTAEAVVTVSDYNNQGLPGSSPAFALTAPLAARPRAAAGGSNPACGLRVFTPAGRTVPGVQGSAPPAAPGVYLTRDRSGRTRVNWYEAAPRR